MRIGIDARMGGQSVGGSGLGRYIEQLVKELPHVDSKNRYLLFKKQISNSNNQKTGLFQEKKADVHWYTLREQCLLPKLIDQEHLDLVHFPHWNVPIRLKTPFVVTIHDLILLEEPASARATTRHPIVYALKYAGFKRVLSHAVHASKKIMTISNATKTEILKHFPDVSEKKISVIYEGVTSLPSPVLPCPPFPYLLYVGNSYPHKNLHTLLNAFDLLQPDFQNLHLIFAGQDDLFSRQLEQKSQTCTATSFISFVRNPNDSELATLYAGASAYLFPSRIEGFGLPALEAMKNGVPVVCSDIPVLHEVLGESAIFFSPKDPQHMAKMIASILKDNKKRMELIQKGSHQVKRYSWKRMAQETVRVYQSCAHS